MSPRAPSTRSIRRAFPRATRAFQNVGYDAERLGYRARGPHPLDFVSRGLRKKKSYISDYISIVENLAPVMFSHRQIIRISNRHVFFSSPALVYLLVSLVRPSFARLWLLFSLASRLVSYS